MPDFIAIRQCWRKIAFHGESREGWHSDSKLFVKASRDTIFEAEQNEGINCARWLHAPNVTWAR